MDTKQITVDGRTYEFARLNLKTIRRLDEGLRVAGSGDMNGIGAIDTMLDAVHAAVARVHPEVTRNELEEALDGSSILAFFREVIDFSGLGATKKGEAASA